MNDLERFLETFRFGPILEHRITTNGNCFFHALEYALGKCELDAKDLTEKERRLLNEDRTSVSELLKVLYNNEHNSVVDSTDRKIVQNKFNFVNKFSKTNVQPLEYSTEPVIFVTAMMKSKILVVVDTEPLPGNTTQFGFSLIEPPGVTFTKENLVILIRSDGNHYNTLKYPLVIPDVFMKNLKAYKESGNALQDTTFEVKVTTGSLRELIPVENTSQNEEIARLLQANEESRKPKRPVSRPPSRPAPVRRSFEPANSTNKNAPRHRGTSLNRPVNRLVNRPVNKLTKKRRSGRNKDKQFPPTRKIGYSRHRR
jgi:hypothetical protein